MQNLKTELLNGEKVYYHNDESIAVAFYSKLTGYFCYMFNYKVLFSFKDYKAFLNKLESKNSEHKMVVSEED